MAKQSVVRDGEVLIVDTDTGEYEKAHDKNEISGGERLLCGILTCGISEVIFSATDATSKKK